MPLFVTVTPGTTITNSTTLDATVLNLLGTPAIDVTGTVDGGSLSLSAGSVGTSELSDNAVTNTKLADMTGPSVKGRQTGTGDPENVTIDNSTVEIATVSSSPTLRVKDTGISYAKIQNTVNGKRLIGRAGTAGGVVGEIEVGSGLSLSDGGVLTVTNAYVKFTVTTAIPTNAGGQVIGAGSLPGIEHQLGGMPSLFRIYARLNDPTTSAGYQQFDIVPIESFVGNGYYTTPFSCWANADRIGLVRNLTHSNIYMLNKTTGEYVEMALGAITPSSQLSKWNLLIEAVRFI